MTFTCPRCGVECPAEMFRNDEGRWIWELQHGDNAEAVQFIPLPLRPKGVRDNPLYAWLKPLFERADAMLEQQCGEMAAFIERMESGDFMSAFDRPDDSPFGR